MITQWNEGAASRKTLMETIGLKPSVNSEIALKQQNKNRIRHAHKKLMDKYKNRRHALRSIRKNKKKGKIAYIPGVFNEY